MPTLDELMQKFASQAPATNEEPTGGDRVVPETQYPAVQDGTTKLASGGESMKSLADIYLSLADADHEKVAAAHVPAVDEEADEVDFNKLAEQMADAEADELVQGDDDMLKVASEYDAAGRIMARGFYDEFMKLAGNMDTDVTPNQTTESPSHASTPAHGTRGLPTVETNFAGNEKHDGKIETAGAGPKQVYKDVLKSKKSISAGQGTGDNPESAAVGLGGGSPAGFATVRDLSGGKSA